jgi:hypothetical protein
MNSVFSNVEIIDDPISNRFGLGAHAEKRTKVAGGTLT